MSERKRSGKGRKGKILPVDFSLTRVLANIREKSYQSSSNRSRFILTGKDMLMLGRLTSAWPEIAGLSLASKTCPARLIKGKLYLTVSDSQWLQTLTFVKPQLLSKLAARFPECKIFDIVGRPGRIPEKVAELVQSYDWPKWQKIQDIELKAELDDETMQIIKRCRKKLLARVEGLKKKGMHLCPTCEATMTGGGECAICRFDARQEIISRVRTLLNEMPWLDFTEIIEFESSITQFEYEAVKSDLIEFCFELIEDLSSRMMQYFAKDTFRKMKKEMVRAISLHTGCMPDQVDLDHLSKEQILVPEWPAYLAIGQEKEAC
jgi:hypothetical protein